MSAAYLVIAFLGGGVLAWIVAGARAKTRAAGAEGREAELRRQLETSAEEVRSLNQRLAEAQESRAAAETRATVLADAQAKLTETFKSLANDALAGNLAEAERRFKALKDDAAEDLGTLLEPLSKTLAEYQRETRELDAKRQREIGSVGEQLRAVAQTEAGLQSETAKLVNALRSHQARGRWGEVTLRRTVELAGMSAYCDFAEQERGDSGDGRLRPDMTVKLPAGRIIVVDSKVPLDGFLDATDARSEEQREAGLERYAAQVKTHVSQLAAKEYWTQFATAPEFVVLFIPNDSFLGAAAERDRGLIEFALDRRVAFATPSTLFALLCAVERGWRQEQMSQSAQKISALGQDLYDRLAGFTEHLSRLGDGLAKAVEAYHGAKGALDRRVLPKARELKSYGAGGKKEFEELPLIDQAVQTLPPPEAEETG